ncbi:hypothetical protein IWQ60_005878 [Tieghemiomyces parasiticus]|uniref:tRNA pseudouridine(55) synthase n=1 Tax=Tieghemiomyces parasiticus TaxID=78921 RepID=A0A9W8DYH0_9FUNG|nr:hypothetical protein IWQ60_005878 [Tieghemiomyces parasiticus]
MTLPSASSEYALQEISTKYLLRARLARAIGEVCQMAAKSDVEADLSVTLAVEHPESADEYQFLSAITPAPPGRSYKGRGDTLSRRCDNTHNVLAFLNKASPQDLRSHNFFPPPAPTTRATLSSVTVARKSRFIAGRYTKYSRNVSNSPFIINNVKVAPTSVAEQIGLPLQEAYQATDYKFVGSGREDVDVRMLGTGRPFYIELVNPRRAHLTPEELDNVRQTAINSFAPVQAVGILREIKAHLTAGIKEGEENKTKEYACLVWLKDPIAADEAAVKVRPYQEGFTVQQKCPVRVMNRRALLTRPKQIHTLDVKILEPHFALVTLSTEAGTYIKEFVHSDCGRSSPSLAEILDTSADLLELDVVNVDLAWPPAAES